MVLYFFKRRIVSGDDQDVYNADVPSCPSTFFPKANFQDGVLLPESFSPARKVFYALLQNQPG